MIYSKNVNKICAVCRHAEKIYGSETHITCKLKNEYRPAGGESCPKFEYDILKKPTHRKKKLRINFDPEDFTI